MAIKKSELYSSLWKSCDELRGGMDASQYKDYVLVLLFMKYVSDKAASQKGYLLDVPKGGGFADMVALKGGKEIGDKINKIIGKLADANDLSPSQPALGRRLSDCVWTGPQPSLGRRLFQITSKTRHSSVGWNPAHRIFKILDWTWWPDMGSPSQPALGRRGFKSRWLADQGKTANLAWALDSETERRRLPNRP